MDRWVLLWLVVALCLTVALSLTVARAAHRRRRTRCHALGRGAPPARAAEGSERSRPPGNTDASAAGQGMEPGANALGHIEPRGADLLHTGGDQLAVDGPRARLLGAEPQALEQAPAPERSSSTTSSSTTAASPPSEHSRPSLIVLRRPRATRHPILLAHGYFGFDRIGVAALGQEYFRGVRPRLEALGYSVFVTRVSPAGGIALRAAQLARQIERLGTPVNIIAHSMGGLDARLAISHLGLAARVASLTTIGTPHHGTPLADMAASFGEWRTLRLLLSSIGVNIDGLYDVSTRRMRDFNRVILDCPGVVYASVVGALNADALNAVHSLLSPGHAYLLRKAGPNDGVVPATSQRWGESIAQVEADHWAQIGWFGSFDVESFYVQLAEGLAARDL